MLRKLYYQEFKREFAARESVSFELFKSSALAMPGRGKRANSTAKAIIYNVYKYFEESAKNKCRRPPKLTSKTAEATGYSVVWSGTFRAFCTDANRRELTFDFIMYRYYNIYYYIYAHGQC